VPLGWIPVVGLGAVALALLLGLALRRRTAAAPRGPTWDCGYAQPTARMQYTGRSFGEWISARLLPRWLGPVAEVRAPEGLFPREARFATDTPDPFRRRLYEPWLASWAKRFVHLRWLQQGRLRVYLVYILVTLLLLLGWTAL